MIAMTHGVAAHGSALAAAADFVTVMVADQAFGVPIGVVHDVFIADLVTPVPLTPVEIAGLLNLRGRVMTVLCLRRLLRLPPPATSAERMVVGIEHGGESFGLMVDAVGEVLTLPLAGIRPNPMNLKPRWAIFSKGVYGLDAGLVIILDPDAILAPEALGLGRTIADKKGQTE